MTGLFLIALVLGLAYLVITHTPLAVLGQLLSLSWVLFIGFIVANLVFGWIR